MAKASSVTKPTLTDAQKAALKAKQDVEKRAAFVKVVSPRVGKALKAIRLIGNCASANYIYKPEQAACIVAALEGAVQGVKDIYAKKAAKQSEFTLPE